MPTQHHATARSQQRETIPLPMRVYGLEGITQTQDEAIGEQAITLAKHDERLGGHDVALAVLTNQVTTLVAAVASSSSTMTKLMWSLISFSTAITLACLTAVLTGLIG